MNFYARNVGDYLRDTVDLSMLEDGAYTRLLDQYYARGEPLPTDKGKVFRMARASTPAERAAVDSILRRFFVLTPTGWRNKRADVALAEQHERSTSARQSAKIRWNKTHANSKADPMRSDMRSDMRTHSEGNATAMLTSNHQPITSIASRNASFTPSDVVLSRPNGGKKPSTKKATRLPEDWRLPPEWKEWAFKAHAIDAERAVRISLSFRDFWISKPGRAGTKLDWAATWRNWIRKVCGDE